jgi:leader peptidase (prepilin peptidase)/N-methyltransferase
VHVAASLGCVAAAALTGPPLTGLAAAVPARGRPHPGAGWWHGAPTPVGRTAALTASGCLLAGLVGAILPISPMAPACWLLAMLAVPLAVIDLARHRLPDLLVVPLAGAVLAAAAASWPATGTPSNLIRGLVASLIALTLLGLPAVAAPGRLGAGDAKLAAALAMLLAWHSWTTLLAGAAYTALLAGIHALLLLATRRISRHNPIPLGPALLAGTLIAVLAAQPPG